MLYLLVDWCLFSPVLLINNNILWLSAIKPNRSPCYSSYPLLYVSPPYTTLSVSNISLLSSLLTLSSLRLSQLVGNFDLRSILSNKHYPDPTQPTPTLLRVAGVNGGYPQPPGNVTTIHHTTNLSALPHIPWAGPHEYRLSKRITPKLFLNMAGGK